MAQPLQTISVRAPGFYGLNLQSSGVGLEPGWSLRADNVVIDENGRPGSRKGWTQVTTTSIGAYDLVALHEYVNATGATEIISAANNNIYKGTTALTSIYSTAVTDNYWKCVSFNGKAYLFQDAQVPLTYDGTTCQTIASVAGFTDVNNVMAKKPNEVLAAYGRLWLADAATDKTTVWYSDNLLGHVWSGGAAGSLDVRSVWTNGMDSIVALAAFNGYLIIFGKKSILVYQGASAPSTMSLVEHIKGVGCVARDSVQDIGTDIIFLSDSGVRSLSRTIQEKSMPMRDISKNVRNDLLSYASGETAKKIKSVYHEKTGFYLLTFPTNSRTYCFDMRTALEDGSARTSVWNQINPLSFVSSRDRELYIGKTGVIGKYDGNTDNGTNFRFAWYLPWLDFQNSAVTKFLKQINATILGGSGMSVVHKWAHDYSGTYSSDTGMLGSGTTAYYGIAEYGIAEYGSGTLIGITNAQASGAGKVIQIGLESEGASSISIQQLDIYAKLGKLG